MTDNQIPVLIVCATEFDMEAMSSKSFLYNSLFRETEPHAAGFTSSAYILEDRFRRFHTFVDTESTVSCAEAYNLGLDFAKKNEGRYDHILFISEDVSVEDSFFFHKLKKSLANNDIVGLAGASEINLDDSNDSEASWLDFSEDINRTGVLTHYVEPDIVITSSYGVWPKKCDVIDGSFILCNLKSILENGIRFDEKISCPEHFYDLDFCLQAGKEGLKISSWPIWTIQKPSPPPDEADEDFISGRKYFFEKWK